MGVRGGFGGFWGSVWGCRGVGGQRVGGEVRGFGGEVLGRSCWRVRAVRLRGLRVPGVGVWGRAPGVPPFLWGAGGIIPPFVRVHTVCMCSL